jgi:hypothetical protein
MRDDLVGDTPCIPADPCGIQIYGAMKPLRPVRPAALGRAFARPTRRNMFSQSARQSTSRLSEPARHRRHLGLVLFQRYIGADQES